MGLVPARDDDSIDMLNGLLRRVDELERLGASRWGVHAGPYTAAAFSGGFSGSWGNFGTPWQDLRARLEGNWVRVEGLVFGGATTTTIVTFATGWRPPKNLIFPAVLAIAGAQVQVRLELTSAGVLSGVWAGGGSAQFLTTNFTFSLA